MRMLGVITAWHRGLMSMLGVDEWTRETTKPAQRAAIRYHRS